MSESGRFFVAQPDLALRRLLDVGEDGGKLLLVERFLDEQLTYQLVEDVAVLVNDVPCFGMRSLHKLEHFLVDVFGGVRRPAVSAPRSLCSSSDHLMAPSFSEKP